MDLLDSGMTGLKNMNGLPPFICHKVKGERKKKKKEDGATEVLTLKGREMVAADHRLMVINDRKQLSAGFPRSSASSFLLFCTTFSNLTKPVTFSSRVC